MRSALHIALQFAAPSSQKPLVRENVFVGVPGRSAQLTKARCWTESVAHADYRM